ncbi:neuronal pentraxin-1-like [Scleropages formosus]|nr:neuronal pentraxin-1-like [Scleropages formosus]
MDAEHECSPTGRAGHRTSRGGLHGNAWADMTDEAKTTILHLRESLVRQKETILDQRETIRELTAKLALCEGFGRGVGGHEEHQSARHPHLHHSYPKKGHYMDTHHSVGGRHSDPHSRGSTSTGDKHPRATPPDHIERTLRALKERLESLQARNTTSSYSSSLRDLLQRRILALEHQMNAYHASSHGTRSHHDHNSHHSSYHERGDHDDHHQNKHVEFGHHDNHHSEHYNSHFKHHKNHHDHILHREEHHVKSQKGRTPKHGHQPAAHGSHAKLDTVLSHLHPRNPDTGSHQKPRSPEAFQIGFPMQTNYMHARVKRTIPSEMFAFTLCLWLKGGAGPGLGTPLSYSVPTEANELVLMEWGNNPMELLVNDKAVTLPISLTGGTWHHVCVTWSARDGLWEAFLDGMPKGSGEDLSAWHTIKPGGVFILGQEQDTMGGRFDATQAFVGEMSDVQLWSHVLTTREIYNLATCRNHVTGDIISWTETAVELHGGVTKYPFDPCY